jgi:hypothetical protein
VRLLDRSGIVPPLGPLVRGTAEWTAAELDWGTVYEPHRHPSGAEIGSRLALRPGPYTLELKAAIVPSTLDLPTVEIRSGSAVSASGLAQDPSGMLSAGFAVLPGRETSLVLRGGGPLILNEIRLRRSTFSPAGGPTR